MDESVSVSPGTELGPHVCSAQVVFPCADLGQTLGFFIDRLGFKLDLIFPADAPTAAVVSGHGVTIRLESGLPADGSASMTLRLHCDFASLPPDTPSELLAPGGVRIVIADFQPPIEMPPARQEFVITRMSGDEAWGTGRAGMLYRDLIPSRLGGRFIASHIKIPVGGPVPDYVHFHKVRFQMIYCRTGWAKLVYEDQGEPFFLKAGDCVLQPPEIRHRVLESSSGLEVIEIGCPAVHETCVDHVLLLPTGRVVPERRFGGQRFVRHVAATAIWAPWRGAGFEARDTGISAATDGLAGVCIIRPFSRHGGEDAPSGGLVDFPAHAGEFLFFFVLRGELGLAVDGLGQHNLHPGDSVHIPAGVRYSLHATPELELLEVTLPAGLPDR